MREVLEADTAIRQSEKEKPKSAESDTSHIKAMASALEKS